MMTRTPLIVLVILCAATLADGAAAAPAPATKPAYATTKPTKKQAKRDAKELFEEGLIPRLRIQIANDEMNRLRQDQRRYVKCNVHEVIPGRPGERVYKDVGIHLKGGPGSFRPIEDRPALTLSFNRFDGNLRFHGLDQISLNNSVQDGTYMMENIAGIINREVGIPAARSTNARVWLNGRDLGFYVLKEGFDDSFLEHNFKEDEGVIFEGSFTELHANMALKNAKKIKDHKPLRAKMAELERGMNIPDPVKRREAIEKVLDVDEFITFIAMEGLMAHWDGYSANRNNYRVYLNPKTQKFTFIAHGLDQVFQNANYPVIIQNGTLARVLTETPEDRAKYMARLEELRKKVLDPEYVNPMVDRIAANILPTMKEMGTNHARQHEGNAQAVKARLTDRGRQIDRVLNARPLRFDDKGVALLGGKGVPWDGKLLQGDAKFERVTESGKSRLKIACNGPAVASWRTTVLLAGGKYAFEGQVKATNVNAPALPENAAVGLRISGGKRLTKLTGTTDLKPMSFEFEVPGPSAEVVLVCEMAANAGEAVFDLDSLKLRKK